MAVFAAFFSAAIRKIIIAAAVFFAAGLFNISANAQYVSEATARVYRPMGTLPVQPDFGGNPTMINFNRAVADIIPDIPDSTIQNGIVRTFFRIVIGTNAHTADAFDTTTGLPDFGVNGGLLNFGQTVLFAEENWGPANTIITTRIYRGADGRHYMAAGEGTELPAPAVAPENVSMVIGDEFFILGDTGDANAWTTVRTISRNAIEFMPAVCASNYELQQDMITCQCPATLPMKQNGMCVVAPPTLNCDAASTTGQNGDECTCRDGFTERVSPEMCRMPQNPQTGNNTQPQKSDGKNHTGAIIFGGLMIMGAIGYAIDGDVSPFNFAPDFGYRISESGYAANAGGRIDFRKDNWHLYQSADSDFHRNGSFEFRYTSGGKYKGDLFSASFSESVSGETADYDLSLSADLRGGIWKISPVYRLHSEYEKGEFTTRNSLNLQSEFRHNGWQIRPSAGFRWENANGFAENARFRIDAVHRF